MASHATPMRHEPRALALLGSALVLGCGSQETSSGFIGEPIESSVTINEVFVKNKELSVALTNYVKDGHGEPDAWIELYNVGTEDACLGGYWMSDDSRVPKSELPDEVVVPAGGVFLLWADADTAQTKRNEVHLNFDLKMAGNSPTVVLFDFEQKWLDQMWVPQPSGEDAVTWVRCPDGSGPPTSRGTPSPGETNESSCP